MTIQTGTWTRRQFSQVLAAAAASSVLTRASAASLAADVHDVAFVGSVTPGSAHGALRVFRRMHSAWSEVHAVEAAAPAGMILHPSAPVLYVLHDVAEWDHRPRGAVSAYHFDAATGRLNHRTTQALSLSATHPRNAVVTADGQALFVAAQAGGIYNVLPLAPDGDLQPVSAIRKEFGRQDGILATTSAPGRLVLDRDGSVYAADAGQQTVTRFAVTREAITVQHRSRLRNKVEGSQPADSALGRLYEANAAAGTLTGHSTVVCTVDASNGLLRRTAAHANDVHSLMRQLA